jgi:uncharacterized protein with PIN domain
LKFVADAMLGGLARWLRMMGQDVVYSTELVDNQLLELSRSDDRALLTRDFELYKRAIGRGLDAFYVQEQAESGRLAEIAKRYGISLEIDMDKAHCPICNIKVQAAPKKELKNQVQPNTYAHYDRFWCCPNCGQIYWQGAHWAQINYTLTQAQTKLENIKENNGV